MYINWESGLRFLTFSHLSVWEKNYYSELCRKKCALTFCSCSHWGWFCGRYDIISTCTYSTSSLFAWAPSWIRTYYASWTSCTCRRVGWWPPGKPGWLTAVTTGQLWQRPCPLSVPGTQLSHHSLQLQDLKCKNEWKYNILYRLPSSRLSTTWRSLASI